MILSKPVQHIHRNWANAPCNSLNSPVDIALSSAHHSRAIQHKVTQQGLLWGCIGPPQHARLPRRTCFEHYPIQGYPGGPILELCSPIIHCKITQGGPPSSGGQMHRTVQCKVTNNSPVQGPLSSGKAALSSTAALSSARWGLHFPAQLLHYPVLGPLSSGDCVCSTHRNTIQCRADIQIVLPSALY